MSCKRIGIKNGVSLYEITIECGCDSITGNRVRKRKRFSGTKTEAELFEAKLKKQYYHKGEKMNLNDLTFKEYSEKFINNYCVPNISKITTKGYKQMLVKILPLIGDIKLTKLNSFMLDTMYQKIKVSGKNNQELSPKSMLHYYNLISVMLNQAKKWKFIENNPNEDAIKPKLVKRKRHFYDNEQAIHLLECISKENIKVKTLITLALYTGARKSELCAIRWPDIDFEEKTLFIDNSLKVIDGVVDEEKAKTEYSIRYVDLGDNIITLLKEYKEWQDNYIVEMGSKWIGTDRVFTAINGKHMHPDTPNKILQKVLTKYDLPKLTFHELRHTYASILNGNGIDAKTISEQLGHSNTSITMNIYTHSFDNKKRESAKVFDTLQKSVNSVKN